MLEVILLMATSEEYSACSLPLTVMVLEFVATPGSLQESFLKRKQNFIQKSLKRVEGIKTKERANEKPEARRSQRGKSEKLSRQKESSPISGRFIWGQKHHWISFQVLFCIEEQQNFTVVASLLLQTGLFFSLSSQGCGELFPHCLATSSVSQRPLWVFILFAPSVCMSVVMSLQITVVYQRATTLRELMGNKAGEGAGAQVC